MQAVETAYDRVLYPSAPLLAGRVEHIAAIALANGIPAAHPDGCRYLEIGCGSGWHLIALALAHPDSEFVGIDLSARAIEIGLEIAGRIGLPNLRLQQYDLTEIDASFGEFDYILAHGVYSWVPPFVAERLLQVTAERLRPAGAGYISYNTRPYSYLREMMREAAEFHIANVGGSRADAAVALFELLKDAVPGPTFLQTAAGDEYQKAERSGKGYVNHDILGEVFRSFRYVDFAESAGRHGLTCFDDAETTARESMLKVETIETLRSWRLSAARYQQYLDYLETASFRRTLMHRADLQRGPEVLPVDRFYAASPIRLEEREGGIRVIRKDGASFRSAEGLLIEAFRKLREAWPRVLPCAELGLSHAELWRLYRNGFLILQQSASSANMPGDRPRAHRLVLAELASGLEYVHNPYHQVVHLEAPADRLVAQCDGTRTRDEIAAQMRLVTGGSEADVREAVNRNLDELGRLGIFAE